MPERQEAVVRSLLGAFIAGDFAGALEHFAADASYRVNVWNEPLVGHAAINGDFERQAALWTDFRYDLVSIASTDGVVLTERVDRVHMMDRDVEIHAVGVFDVGSDGKITSWRDYFDMKEIEDQLAGESRG